MAWLAVDKDGTEKIFNVKPFKGNTQKDKNHVYGTIDIIIVEHKDRLARFGINYIEKLLALDGRKIEIVNPQMNERDDLMQDFVSIVTSFCARLYGKRRTKRQTEKIIEELTNDNK